MRVSNNTAREKVNNKVNFDGSNTYGRNEGKKYVVYSYGTHFPIYVFKRGKWYGNTDKYSVSTSKHQSQLQPLKVDYWRNTEQIKHL